MRVGRAFPTKFLRVEDLDGNRVTVKISRVEIEDVGDGEKPVIYFSGKKKGLVCNKTNAETITEICGTDEMDDWAGITIVLKPDKTKYAGKTVPCIRIAEAAAGKAAAVPAKAKKPTPAVEVEADPEDDEANVGREPGEDDGDDEGFV